MIRFNIIATTGTELGYLDGTPDSVSFKRRNKQFFWAKMEMGRSTEFQVPATDHNRILLGFGNDPEEYGEVFRYPLRAQMQTSGNAITGNLDANAVPEPATWLLLLLGAFGLMYWRTK